MKKSKYAGSLLFDLIVNTFSAIAVYFFTNVIILFGYNWFVTDTLSSLDYNTILFENLTLMKIMQGIASIIIFVFPVYYMYKKHSDYLGKIGFYKTKTKRFLWVFLIYIICVPLIQYTGVLNQKIHFPASFSHIETYLKSMEHQANVLTKTLLKGTEWYDLVLNILIIAVLPAVCEELFFRGVLQKIFNLMFKNIHLSIWITAFVFSVLHFQFYGILPRFLIGITLGYIYAYGRNMWYNIFLHFINNGLVVGVYYYLLRHNLPLEYADKGFDIPVYIYPVFVLLLVTTIRVFKSKTKLPKLRINKSIGNI